MAQFPFGTNNEYYTDTGPSSDTFSKMAAGVFGATTVAAALGSGFLKREDGSNLFDSYYRVAKTVGNLSPYGLFASVRAAEAMSPFLSEKMQASRGGQTKGVTWNNEFLHDESTKKWVAAVTGKSVEDLTNMGFGTDTTKFMSFNRTDDYGRGVLKYGNDILADDIMLYERDLANEAWSDKRTVNQLAEALGSVIDEDNSLTSTFTTKPQKKNDYKTSTHSYLPGPSVTGPIKTTNDLLRRASYFRTIFAFEAQRFNQAIRTIGEAVPIIGPHISSIMRSETYGVRNTTALKQWGRYAKFASGLGLAAGGIASYDHWQRYSFDDPITSGIFGGLSFAFPLAAAKIWQKSLTSKEMGLKELYDTTLGSKGNKIAFGLGVAATLLMPGFDKGLVAGVSQTLANVDIGLTAIGDVTGLSWWRKNLDDVFPGITDNSTAILAGFGAYALSQANFYHENRYYKFFENYKAANDKKASPMRGLDYANPTKIFSDDFLDTVYESLEKVTKNLGPSDDIKDFRREYAAGQWTRDTIPFESENKALEEVMKKIDDGTENASQKFAQKLMATFGYAPGQPTPTLKDNFWLKSSHAKIYGMTSGAVAFLAGGLAWKALTSGFLGSLDSAETKQRQYSGRESVAVRKSRWWGAGSGPYEGGKISHYKPSLNALIQSDAENQSIWGDEASSRGPIERFILKNFTYHLEDKHKYDRPYPISAPAFADIPFFGRLLGATIGRILKPQRFYRQEEWYQDGQYLNVPDDKDSNPYIPDGGLGIGTPVNPFSLTEAFGKTQYNMREAEGFIGFLKNAFQATLTGEETYSSGPRVLFADSSQMSSTIRDFWELDLGGLASLSEIPRRFLPKERIQDRNRYNPINNTMPSWMPEKFQRGDPYTKIPLGYARLPGEGYASLHPELKGVDPEFYPIINRYDILANTAYYSTEFRMARAKVKKKYDGGTLTEEEKRIFEMREKELDLLKLKRNYFIESEEQHEQSLFKRFLRKNYMAAVAQIKDIAAPIEYLTFGGARPTHKFLPVGDVLDDYERFAIFGSETSFWELSKGYQDYLGPSMQYLLRNLSGGLLNGVPESLEARRDMDQYFDRLNYFKYMKLAEQARMNGKSKDAAAYSRAAHKTVFGTNTNAPILKQYSALPQAEKERFEGFRRVTDRRKRERILDLLPEDVKPIMISVWDQQEGKNPSRQSSRAQTDDNKMAIVEDYLTKEGMPEETWAGWNPHMDMSDVKLKYVEENGYDPMQFNYWPSQEAMLARKPYTENIETGIPFHTSVGKRLFRNNIMGYNEAVAKQVDAGARIDYKDDRTADINREENLWGNES